MFLIGQKMKTVTKEQSDRLLDLELIFCKKYFQFICAKTDEQKTKAYEEYDKALKDHINYKNGVGL